MDPMSRIVVITLGVYFLWPTESSLIRQKRAMGELVMKIKGFDNCTENGKNQFKWHDVKMKFGKNSRAVFNGGLYTGFPITDDGSTLVKMTTYVLQNGGYKLLFKSETKGVFSLLNRVSPELVDGVLKCFRLTEFYIPPGDHNCTDWHLTPFRKALPVRINSKAYIVLDFYRDKKKMGCTKVLLDISS